MASFEVHGPFKIAFEKRRGGRTLVFDGFWSNGADALYLSEERGCYVFAIRNRALTPIYIGQGKKDIQTGNVQWPKSSQVSQRIQRLREGLTGNVLCDSSQAEGTDKREANCGD